MGKSVWKERYKANTETEVILSPKASVVVIVLDKI